MNKKSTKYFLKRGVGLFSRVGLFLRDYNNQILMSASPTREVVTTTVMTLMEVTHVLAVMATSVTVIDTHEENNNRHLQKT